jgi:hypothetical protein
MHDDIHRRALAAAIRLSLGAAASTMACRPSASDPPQPPPTGDDGASDAKLADATPEPREPGDAPAVKSCDGVLDAAFPGHDTEYYPPKGPANTTPGVVECCQQQFAEHGSASEHHWACCATLPEAKEAPLLQACTPWGPPVPPARDWTPRGSLA